MITYIEMIPNWVWGLLLLAVWFGVMNVLKISLFKKIAKAAAKTSSDWDDILLKAMSFPATIIILVLGLQVINIVFPLEKKFQKYFGLIGIVGAAIAVTYFADRLLVNFIKVQEAKKPNFKSYAGLAKTITHIIVYALGLMVVLDSLGVSVTPIIASLGVGSIAIALALQDTLANLFSGLYVLMDQPISVGHYIKLSSGEEGFVEHIGWRSVRIKDLANNLIIVPNNKVSNTILVNYDLPASELAIFLNMGVQYGSDLEAVEKVVIEVGKGVMKEIEGGVASFVPFIRYNQFGDNGVQFAVILRVKNFTNKFLVTHEFLKRLHVRFEKEGIKFATPTRKIIMKQDEH